MPNLTREEMISDHHLRLSAYIGGRVQKGFKFKWAWDLDHVFLQQKWFKPGSWLAQKFPRLAEQLRRFANGGWNLVPIPSFINRGILNCKPKGLPLYQVGFSYFPLLAVCEPTDISARNLGIVLGAVDARPDAEHYYSLLHVLPHRRLEDSEIARVRRRFEGCGFGEWLQEVA
jgi:hypothetical protein